jgi:hypothetical protein
MGKLIGVEQLFQGRHFDREVIILCVRWSIRPLCVGRRVLGRLFPRWATDSL